MNSIAQQKLQSLLLETFEQSTNKERTFEEFKLWFIQQFDNDSTKCGLSDFAVYFLNSVRRETEQHLRPHDADTPQNQTPVRSVIKTGTTSGQVRKLQPSMLCFEASTSEAFEDVPNYSANQHSLSLNNSSFGQGNASTPVRRLTNTQTPRDRRSHHNYSSSTPNNSDKLGNSRNNSASSSLCLGDFLVLNSSNQNYRSKKRHSLNQTQTGTSAATETTPTGKPKKRVVPTTISSSTKSCQSLDNNPFGASFSSFGNDNNFAKLNSSELEDKNKCLILEARKTLKENAFQISKEMENAASLQSPQRKDLKLTLEAAKLTPIKDLDSSNFAMTPTKDMLESIKLEDLQQIKHAATIIRMGHIYVFLIENHFATNLLNELSFLINLFNLDTANSNQSLSHDFQSLSLQNIQQQPLSLLKSSLNCIQFALGVLQLQQHLLQQLDVKSLGVILSTQRLSTLDESLGCKLQKIYQQKQQLDALKSSSLPGYGTPCKLRRPSDTSQGFVNVYYHEDQDSRQHFPSNVEFFAFKTQRDLFYKSLKQWELNHLKPSWSFSVELTPKIRELFRLSENAINMSHFAKLFVAQLLISSKDTKTPEDMGLEVDVQKFNKLAQRLIAPSNFSVDYQFPRGEAFFRDFIQECSSWAFYEHLKLALYAELMALNDCSMDQLTLYSNAWEQELEEQEDELLIHSSCSEKQHNVVVRPEVLASMLILAKFLGFLSALPYDKCSSSLETSVKQQVSLRSLFQPNFSIAQLLREALKHGKLLITLPWLVQYMIMLDPVTLQMSDFQQCLLEMFELYANLNVDKIGTFGTLPFTAQFIVRCCLGWLFENKPFIAEQYYAFLKVHISTVDVSLNTDLKEEEGDTETLSAELIFVNKSETKSEFGLNPLLESTLNVACPFLADFRVSIMPAKHAQAKYLSRTGRYRHITTRLTELPTVSQPEIMPHNKLENSSHFSVKKQQSKLIDAFLHSQNSSTRRLIPFVTERIYKCVIKDAQHKILLPSKSAADAEVNLITSYNYEQVYESVSHIYVEARRKAMDQWAKDIPQMLTQRTSASLTALLPNETLQVIKQTYAMLIRQNAAHKISQWFHANVVVANFYCPNLPEMVNKICKANNKPILSIAPTNSSSELILKANSISVSDLVDDLQYWLHVTSNRPDLFQSSSQLLAFVQQIPLSFSHNTLPSVFYGLIGNGIMQIMKHLIDKHPLTIDEPMLMAFIQIWQTTPIQSESSSCPNVASIFDSLITTAFIKALNHRTQCYEKLQQFLLCLLQHNMLTVDYLNTQFVQIFKHEWSPATLAQISQLLRGISQHTASTIMDNKVPLDTDNRPDTEEEDKSHLFMELLADLSKDSEFI